MLLSCLLLSALSVQAAPAPEASPKPVADGALGAAPPKKSKKQQWAEIAELVEKAHGKETRFGAVAVYDIYDQPRLPPRIFIVSQAEGKVLVESLLEGTLEPGWRETGKYWVVTKDEAVRRIGRAMRKKGPELASVKESIERELGPALFLVYRVHKGQPAALEPEPAAPDGPAVPLPGPIEDPKPEAGLPPAPKAPPAPKK